MAAPVNPTTASSASAAEAVVVLSGYPRTAELLTELSDASPEFREPWAEHRLKDKTHGRYVYRHPVVGELDLGFETLRLPDDPDQALIAHTVEEDSPSHTALRLLAGWAHETLPTG
ncbi:hypothetical protein [Streptomyces lydicus]|uniref:MmyB family transcriptional regulator n=1 Tax=Streptomyces lydicus TaxID=47763 RepID=UPI0037BCC246